MQVKPRKYRNRKGSKIGPGQKPLDDRFESVAARVDKMDAGSSALRTELDRLADAQESVTHTTAELGKRVEALSDKVNGVEQMLSTANRLIDELNTQFRGPDTADDETTRMRDQLGAMDEKLTRLEANVSEYHKVPQLARSAAESVLAQLDTDLEKQRTVLNDLEQRVADLSDDLEQRGGTLKDEQQALERQIVSFGQAVDARNQEQERLATHLDHLVELNDRLASQIEGLTGNIAIQSNRQEKIEAQTQSAENAIVETKNLLHKSGEMLLETRKDVRSQHVRLDNLRSGLRVLGWAGVVAAAVLAVLSIAGYLLQDSKLQMLLHSLDDSVDRVERRIEPGFTWDAERAGNLEQDVRDLRSAVRELQRSAEGPLTLQVAEQEGASERTPDDVRLINPREVEPTTDTTPEIPQTEPKTPPSPKADAQQAMPGGDQQDAADASDLETYEGMDPEAQVVEPEVDSEPLIPIVENRSEPTTEEKPTGAGWRTAQQERHHTIQLMSLRKPEPLKHYAVGHGLEERSAVLETTRDGNPWFVLLFDHFPTWVLAKQARDRLPPPVLVEKPWIRRLPQNGRIEPLN